MLRHKKYFSLILYPMSLAFLGVLSVFVVDTTVRLQGLIVDFIAFKDALLKSGIAQDAVVLRADELFTRLLTATDFARQTSMVLAIATLLGAVFYGVFGEMRTGPRVAFVVFVFGLVISGYFHDVR